SSRGVEMTARGLIIAAPQSGAGKTTITLGILAALKRRSIAVGAAKAGPDYIDPAFHAAVTGAPVVNLDSWAMPDGLLDVLAGRPACGGRVGGRQPFRSSRACGPCPRAGGEGQAIAPPPPISLPISICRSCWCSMWRGWRNPRPPWCAVLPPTIPR